MKKLGIIGGLGPQTTADFYLEVVLACSKINSDERPSILIENVSLTKKVEKDFINHSLNADIFLKLVVDSAIRLEKSGVDFIVMPCNTAHVFINEIRIAVDVPVLSILDETVGFVKQKKLKSVLLLATPATIKNKLFDDKFLAADIVMKKPNVQDQKLIGKIVNKILDNKHDFNDQKELIRIITDVGKVDAVILACTDLHILISKVEDMEVIDTMDVLAKATVSEMI